MPVVCGLMTGSRHEPPSRARRARRSRGGGGWRGGAVCVEAGAPGQGVETCAIGTTVSSELASTRCAGLAKGKAQPRSPPILLLDRAGLQLTRVSVAADL